MKDVFFTLLIGLPVSMDWRQLNSEVNTRKAAQFNMTDQPNGLPDIRIFSQTAIPIRNLKTFDRSRHNLPTSRSRSALEFIERLTEGELDAELDRIYSSLRRAFQLKRRQLDVHGPAERRGIIETPWFNFEICVDLSEDAAEVIWTFELNRIAGVDKVTGEEFESCFEAGTWILEVSFANPVDVEYVIDSIEEIDDQSLSVDYDKSGDWCDVQSTKVSALLKVTASKVQIVPVRMATPRVLLEALTEFRSHLMIPALSSS
ncbi:MAG: hypothetical protein AAF456_13155 [Planctomycetota bacterium]